MEQKNKDLLLKDLCARLPYGVKFKWCDGLHDDYYTFIGINEQYIIGRSTGCYEVLFIIGKDEIKPYLRPLSSMTEEEKMEFSLVPIYAFVHYNEVAKMDWLLKHHFDIRGLIPNGSALSTEEFNPYKD